MSQKHTYGNGSIYRRAVDGRWYGALDVGSLDGRRRRVTVSGGRRGDVEARLARLRRRVRSFSDELSVGEFLMHWLTDILPGTVDSPNTVDNYRWVIECHLVPGLGHIALLDLEPADVARFIQSKQRAGLARSSAARLRIVLGTALTHAVESGLVSRNVARLTRTPKGRARQGRSLTLDQARAPADSSARSSSRGDCRGDAGPRAPSGRSSRAAVGRHRS